MKYLLNCSSSPTLPAGRAGDLWHGKNHPVPALFPVLILVRVQFDFINSKTKAASDGSPFTTN